MNRLIFLAAFAAAPCFAQETYEINVHRLHDVRGRVALAGKFTLERAMVFSVEGSSVREDKLSAEGSFAGELEVVSTGPKGQITALKFKVTEWNVKENGNPSAIFKVGDVIAAATGEKGRANIILNGNLTDDHREEIANVFLPIHPSGTVTDNDLIGTGKRTLGESWALNAKEFVRGCSETGLPGLRHEEVTGQSKLEKIEDVDGVKCLRLNSFVSVRGSGMDAPNSPEGMNLKVKSLSMEGFHDYQVPIEKGLPMPWEKSSELAEISANGQVEQDGNKLDVVLSLHHKESLEVRAKLLK